MAGFNVRTVSLLGTFGANSAPLGKISQPSRPLVPTCPVEADLTHAPGTDVAVVAPTVPVSPPGGVNAAWHAAGRPPLAAAGRVSQSHAEPFPPQERGASPPCSHPSHRTPLRVSSRGAPETTCPEPPGLSVTKKPALLLQLSRPFCCTPGTLLSCSLATYSLETNEN